jgi:hypothetical protein
MNQQISQTVINFLIFARYMLQNEIKEKFLSYELLKQTEKAASITAIVNEYFVPSSLLWGPVNSVGADTTLGMLRI